MYTLRTVKDGSTKSHGNFLLGDYYRIVDHSDPEEFAKIKRDNEGIFLVTGEENVIGIIQSEKRPLHVMEAGFTYYVMLDGKTVDTRKVSAIENDVKYDADGRPIYEHLTFDTRARWELKPIELLGSEINVHVVNGVPYFIWDEFNEKIGNLKKYYPIAVRKFYYSPTESHLFNVRARFIEVKEVVELYDKLDTKFSIGHELIAKGIQFNKKFFADNLKWTRYELKMEGFQNINVYKIGDDTFFSWSELGEKMKDKTDGYGVVSSNLVYTKKQGWGEGSFIEIKELLKSMSYSEKNRRIAEQIRKWAILNNLLMPYEVGQCFSKNYKNINIIIKINEIVYDCDMPVFYCSSFSVTKDKTEYQENIAFSLEALENANLIEISLEFFEGIKFTYQSMEMKKNEFSEKFVTPLSIKGALSSSVLPIHWVYQLPTKDEDKHANAIYFVKPVEFSVTNDKGKDVKVATKVQCWVTDKEKNYYQVN